MTFSEVEISAGFRFNGAKERLSFSRTRPIGWRSIARNKMHCRTEPYLHLPPPPLPPTTAPADLLLMGRFAYVRVCSRQLAERCFRRSQLRRLGGPYECILSVLLHFHRLFARSIRVGALGRFLFSYICPSPPRQSTFLYTNRLVKSR